MKINFEEGAIKITAGDIDEHCPDLVIGFERKAIQLISSKEPKRPVSNSESFEIKFSQASE
jgi:hypothetical protein